MRERTRGLLLLFGAAVIAGVFFGVKDGAKRDRRAAETARPSASADPVEVAPPRAATREELESTIARLEKDVRAGASDAKNPWALAHGLVAFGGELRASDGRLAIDAIAGFAEAQQIDGKKLYLFPENKNGQPVEPHRFLQVKTLLETGVAADRALASANGDKITLARLIADMHQAAKLPTSDADYHQVAWLVSALAIEHARDKAVAERAPGPKLSELLPLALTRLESDQRVVSDYAGPVDHAFDEGSALNRAKRDKTGIYGHSCGGLHLVQAVAAAVSEIGSDDDKRRFRKQLGVLLYRYELERTAYASLLARHADQGLLIRVQQLKFFGHVVETLTQAQKLGLTGSDNDGSKKIDATILNAAGDVARVVKELDDGGVYDRLDQIRKDREQTYLDLIGDGCHAIRGLRRAL